MSLGTEPVGILRVIVRLLVRMDIRERVVKSHPSPAELPPPLREESVITPYSWEESAGPPPICVTVPCLEPEPPCQAIIPSQKNGAIATPIAPTIPITGLSTLGRKL